MFIRKIYIICTFKRLKFQGFVYKEVFLLNAVCCNIKIEKNIRIALEVIIIFIKSAEDIIGFKIIFIYKSKIPLVFLIINFIFFAGNCLMKLGDIIPGLSRNCL